MKTNYIPAYVMLAAGLIDSILLIVRHVELYAFLKQLLIVLVVFFIIGSILKLILDIGIGKMADPEDLPDDFPADFAEDAPDAESMDIR